jgi:hypothetical protein
MRTRRSLAQDSVGALGDVFDLNTRHGAIMALVAPLYKHSACDITGVSFCEKES